MSNDTNLFLWGYLLPLFLTMIIVPKHIAMKQVGTTCFYRSKLRWKHILITAIIAVMPIINITAVIMAIGGWIIYLLELLWDTDYFNKPVFSKTKNSK